MSAIESKPYQVDDVHGYFGLSYANYLVLHRTILQSMPDEWQARFVACLNEIDDAIAGFDYEVSWYSVQARGSDNRFMRDPVPHYNRGRTRVPLNPPSETA